MMDDLKPCPVCGGKARRYCPACGARMEEK